VVKEDGTDRILLLLLLYYTKFRWCYPEMLTLWGSWKRRDKEEETGREQLNRRTKQAKKRKDWG